MRDLASLQRKFIAFTPASDACAIALCAAAILFLLGVAVTLAAGFGAAMLCVTMMSLPLILLCAIIANDPESLRDEADKVDAKISRLRSVAKKLNLENDPVFRSNIEANVIRKMNLRRMVDTMKERSDLCAALRDFHDGETREFLRDAIAKKDAERDYFADQIYNAQNTDEDYVARQMAAKQQSGANGATERTTIQSGWW